MQRKKSRRIEHNESGFHFLLTGNLRILFYLKLIWGTKHIFYTYKGLLAAFLCSKEMYSPGVDAWYLSLCDIYLAPLFMTFESKDIRF